MEWTFMFYVLMASAIVAPSIGDGSKHKRSLSLLTSLLSNGRESSHGKCTKSHRKPLKQYDFFVYPGRKNIVLDVPDVIRSQVTKKANNNFDYSFVKSIRQFLASDAFQATTQAIGGMINSLLSGVSTENTINRRPHNVPFVIDRNHISEVKSIPENVMIINEIVNERPKIHATPSLVEFMNPIITMPRKYSYEQIKGESVQKFSLDKNSDVLVTESSTQPPRPAFVEDRINDIILGVPPYSHYFHSNNANKQYGEALTQSNIVSDQQTENVNLNILPSDDSSMYTGEPIMILDDTSTNMKTLVSSQNEINKILERNIIDKQRGDIPMYFK